MFTEKFDKFVCVGDSITCHVGGFDITAVIEYDDCHHIDDDDCHSTDQTTTGVDDEQFARMQEARQAWKDDEWFYCGVVLTVKRNGITLIDSESLWGIEANYPNSDNGYLTEVPNELLPEAIARAKDVLKTLCDWRKD